MKNKSRIGITIILTIILVIGIIALRINVNSQRKGLTCEDIEISFRDSLKFVSVSDIKGWLDTQYGAYMGQRIDSIQLDKIEKILDAQSAVQKSEAFIADDGILHISITQREPALRFQKGEIGFYADQRGFLFPLQKSYSADVPVIEGNIPIHYKDGFKGEIENENERLWMGNVLEMMSLIRENKNWKHKLQKVSVDTKGDLVLKFEDGKEKFTIGKPVGLKDKLERIEKYYNFIRPVKEYQNVSVKFDNEIICK